MKKIAMVALMLMVAGSAYAAMTPRHVECSVKGKTKWVKTVDACKALGGTVVAAKKVS